MKINKIAILIKKASLQFDKISNKILEPYEISATQYKILKFLYAKDNHRARVTDLEEFLSMTHPTTIGHIDYLEKKGLVDRIANPNDARGKLITPTKTALSLENELNKVGEDIENELTKNLNPKEKEEMISLLNKLIGVWLYG